MSAFDLTGPRSISVRLGSFGQVHAGRHLDIETGHGKVKSPPIFDNPVGMTGPHPMDNLVRSLDDKVLGKLEADPSAQGDPLNKILRRW